MSIFPQTEKATEANACMVMITNDKNAAHVHVDEEATPHDGLHTCLHCRRTWVTGDAVENARRRERRHARQRGGA
jgi:hypothetical protein